MVTGLKTQIKWPNDILINGKKVCGILIETVVRGNKAACAIIGIGINIESGLSGVPEISANATSLNQEAGREISRVDLVKHLLIEFERLYLKRTDAESIYEAWRDRLVTLGKSVYIESGSDRFDGVAESVDESGALLVRSADGSSTRIIAGDVTLRDK